MILGSVDCNLKLIFVKCRHIIHCKAVHSTPIVMGKPLSKEIIIAQNASTGAEGYVETQVKQLTIVSCISLAIVLLVILYFVYRKCNARTKKWIGKQMQSAHTGYAQPGGAVQTTSPHKVVFSA